MNPEIKTTTSQAKTPEMEPPGFSFGAAWTLLSVFLTALYHMFDVVTIFILIRHLVILSGFDILICISSILKESRMKYGKQIRTSIYRPEKHDRI